jgi:hypothetical protein
VKKLFAVSLAAVLMFALAGCGEKKEQPKQAAPGMGAPGAMPPAGMPPAGMPPAGMPPAGGQEGMGMPRPAAPRQVVVPDNVKKAWPKAKIEVKKKDGKDGKIYEVTAGQSIDIPGSTLKVEVGQYLPDFFMDGQTITSKSDVQINPAVQITVTEGANQIFRQHIFEKYPEAHMFNHPEWTISLVGGVKGN